MGHRGDHHSVTGSALRNLLAGIRSDLTPGSSERFAFSRGLAHANYDYLTLRPAVPTIELLDLLSSGATREVQIRYGLSWWNIDANSLAALTMLARALDTKSIFEIGTYKGVTTRQLAESCPDARVFTLDLPAAPDAHFTPGEFFQGSDEMDRIHQLYGDSKSFDFAPYAAGMDLVFVDAGHDYEDVCADSESALLMAGERGVVVWDDYTTWTGINRCVNELAGDLPIVHIAGTRLAMLHRPSLDPPI